MQDSSDEIIAKGDLFVKSSVMFVICVLRPSLSKKQAQAS